MDTKRLPIVKKQVKPTDQQGEFESRRYYVSRIMRKTFIGVSDTYQAVKPQKMARGLKFRIYEVEGLYNLFSKNKGADQLRGYCAADL